VTDTTTPAAPQQHSPVTEAVIFAGRLVTHWRRYPIVPIQALLFPTVLLVTYALLVGKSMVAISGNNNLDILLPICAIAGAMAGTLGTAFAIPHDRETGLLTRLWVLPVHRFSALAGTLVAEGGRTLLGTMVMTIVGFPLGLRFTGNWLAFLVFLVIPVIVGNAYALIAITIATQAKSRTMLVWLNSAALGLVFAAAAPPDMVPRLLRPVVQYQPFATAVDSMRLLSQGQIPVVPLLLTLGWVVVMTAVFGPLSMRAYRKAAETAG